MTLEVKFTCPLGHTCEKAVDGVIERCAWYTKIEGAHPQTGENLDEKRCAIAWQPLLMVETQGQIFGVRQGVQSLKNTVHDGQNAALGVVKDVKAITN